MFEALLTKSHYKRHRKKLSSLFIIILAVVLTLLMLLLIWSGEIAQMLNFQVSGTAQASNFWLSDLMRTVYTLALVIPATIFAVNTWDSYNESHTIFEKLFFDSLEPILLYGLDGRIISCNEALAELLGWPVEELKLKSLQDLLYSNGEELPTIFQHIESSNARQQSLAMKNKTGEVVLVEAHQQRVRIKGKVFILAFLQDITLRHRESHKRQMLGEITSAFLQLSDQQKIYETVFTEMLKCCGSSVFMLVEVDLAYQTMKIIRHDGSPLAFAEMEHNLARLVDAASEKIDVSACPIEWLGQDHLNELVCSETDFPATLFTGDVEFIPRQTFARRIFVDGNRITSFVIFDFNGRFDLEFAESILNFFSIALIRVHTEQQLFQNQMQLSETQQLVKVGRFQYDFSTQKSLFSVELCRIFGIEDQEQATDFHMIRSIHPDDRPKYAELLDNIIQNPTDEEIHFNFRINHPDGSLHYMRSQSKIFFDPDHNPVYLITAIHDATDLVETRMQLYESQTRYELLVENSPSLIIVADMQMQVKFNNWGGGNSANPAMLVGSDLISLVGRDYQQRAADAVDQAIASKSIAMVELPIRTDMDGPERWMLVNISPVFLNDEVQEIIFNLSDISDQMRMEANLQRSQHNFELIFEESPALIMITSQADGSILQVNKSFSQLFGITRQYARGKTTIDIGLWKSNAERLQYIQSSRDATTAAGQEIAIDLPDGRVHFSVVIHPIAMEGESCNIVILWDITAQKQIETRLEEERKELTQQVAAQMDELRSANQELSKVMLVKDKFLANMSYELRTPLTVILGVSEALYVQNQQPLTEKQLKFVKMIETSGRELLHLINDILDLTKIGKKDEGIHHEKIILSDLCRSSLMFVQQKANRKKIQLQYNIDPRVGYVWADPIRLKQILTNLLDNGIKFTAENGAVGLNVKPDETGEKVQFLVWDTGIGMPIEEVDRVFEPFVQLAQGDADNPSEKSAGAGLGLALVQQYAELHGGQVEISSVPQHGTTVIVSIPAQHQPTPPGAGECSPDEAVNRR